MTYKYTKVDVKNTPVGEIANMASEGLLFTDYGYRVCVRVDSACLEFFTDIGDKVP